MQSPGRRLVYAGCILAGIVAYAYANRIAPVACFVSFLILALVLVAFLYLAGSSGQTWTDPSNALALLLIACAFLLSGSFIAGASTFGPTRVLDVGIASPRDSSNIYLWNDDHWMEAKLPRQMSYDEQTKIQSWSENHGLTNDLDAKPARILISMWDRQEFYWITMKNWSPPITIGRPPRTSIRAYLDLLLCAVLLGFSQVIWHAGRSLGIRYSSYDPFALLAVRSRRFWPADVS